MLKACAIFAVLLCAAVSSSPARAESNLRVSVTALPPSQFNPLRYTGLPGAYTWSAVFEGLTAFNSKGELVPNLAVSWKNIDPQTWVFQLRPNVKFSNGAPFTADAVVTMVEFLASPAARTEAVARMMYFLKSARAIDPLTVEIKTNVPTPLLPRFMAQLYAVEPQTFKKLGLAQFARTPVATGPFTVEEIQPEKITLRAFRGSWRAPKVDRLEIRALADQATRALAVQAKQSDIALQLGPEDVQVATAGGGHKVAWLDPQIWAYHFVPGRQPATADVKVREALNLAVDRAGIISALLDGASVPATQPAPPTVYGFDPTIPAIPYDPARAKVLLAEAGWPKGFKLEMEATSGSGPNDDLINLTVKQNLAAIGVDVTIRRITSNQIISNSVEGSWKGDAFAIAYSFAPTLDALRGMDAHSCLAGHPWYCNQEVMPLIRAAQVEFEPAKNLQLRRDIMRFYRNDWAALFMFQQARFAATARNVSGFSVVNNTISYDTIVMK